MPLLNTPPAITLTYDSINMQATAPPSTGVRELAWPMRTAAALLSRLMGCPTNVISQRVLLAVKGGSWTLAGYGAGQLFRVATTLLLARMLLGPEAFGLVALVNVFLTGLDMLSDLGIGMDVIQHRRGDDPKFLDTAYLIQAGRSCAIGLVAVLLAYPFASFYGQPAVRSLLFVSGFSVIIRGFASAHVWTLNRRVQIDKLTFITVAGDFSGFICSLVWALWSPTAWALVVGRVASASAYVAVSHYLSERPVCWNWDSTAARDILTFGTGIFFSSSTHFLSSEAERLVMGKFFSLIDLGCFSLALSISLLPTQVITQVISQVFFPMISSTMREDPEKAAMQFKKLRPALAGISAILAAAFILAGPWVVKVVLGQSYAGAGWMLQLLGFRAALQLYCGVAATLLFATGSTSYAVIGNLAKMAFLAVGLSIAFTRFGTHEAVWVLAMSPLPAYFVFIVGLKRKMTAVVSRELVSFAVFLVTAFAAALFTERLYHLFDA